MLLSQFSKYRTGTKIKQKVFYEFFYEFISTKSKQNKRQQHQIVY